MKKIITLSLVLLLAGTSLATGTSQTTGSFETFWQNFKAAVTKRDVEAVARLSKFPIGMSYGIPAIKTKVQLTKRFRQVFNEQTDAANCFGKAKPQADEGDAKHFSVACPDAAGNEVVIYHFEQTRIGWKFTGLDNLNE